MKIYRLSVHNGSYESTGYAYFTNKKEARKAKKEYERTWQHMDHDGREDDPDRKKYSHTEVINELNLELSKDGVLQFLNSFCSYPDNG